jgi:hypothetical protein
MHTMPGSIDPALDVHECGAIDGSGLSALGVMTDAPFASQAWGERERVRRGLEQLLVLPRPPRS